MNKQLSRKGKIIKLFKGNRKRCKYLERQEVFLMQDPQQNTKQKEKDGHISLYYKNFCKSKDKDKPELGE